MGNKKVKAEKGVFDIPTIHAQGYKTVAYSAINGHNVEIRFYPEGDILELIVNNKIISRVGLVFEDNAEVLDIEDPNAI